MAHSPRVNLGRDRAELTIGVLPSWIMQFAQQNYRKDQGGIYHSVAACEYNRSRIAIEVAERLQDVIEDKEDEEAARARQKHFNGFQQSDYGPRW
jgi:protein-arginine kinase activator protein McsA